MLDNKKGIRKTRKKTLFLTQKQKIASDMNFFLLEQITVSAQPSNSSNLILYQESAKNKREIYFSRG